MKERWKAIRDYEGLYEISDLGRVKSCRRVVPHGNSGKLTLPERILRSRINKANGYELVTLSKAGVQPTFRVHVLVAQAFCEGEASGLIVHHLNHEKTDNRAANLEWATRLENTTAAKVAGKMIGGGRNTKLNPHDVQILRAARLIGVPLHEIGEAFNILPAYACDVINGKSWRNVEPPTPHHIGAAYAIF
jgi:hypothetical protein